MFGQQAARAMYCTWESRCYGLVDRNRARIVLVCSHRAILFPLLAFPLLSLVIFSLSLHQLILLLLHYALPVLIIHIDVRALLIKRYRRKSGRDWPAPFTEGSRVSK